jgi:hypothetical protein
MDSPKVFEKADKGPVFGFGYGYEPGDVVEFGWSFGNSGVVCNQLYDCFSAQDGADAHAGFVSLAREA